MTRLRKHHSSIESASVVPPIDLLRELPHRLWIDGQWRDASDGRTFEVTDPATGVPLATVPFGSTVEAEQAVAAAAAALPSWRRRTAEERSNCLGRIYELLLEYREPLTRLEIAELGTPDPNMGGVDYAAGFFRWFAEESRRIGGRMIPHPDPKKRVRVEYFPVGVVGAITPWNGPLPAPAKKVAAALAAGCTVVLKPAGLTPLSALALAWIADKAGLPPGALNVVCGDARTIGRVLLDHPDVRMITFTGSCQIGQFLMREAARQVKRLSLELGGNSPFLIFADADVERAAEDLAALKLANSGQVCVTANRALIQRPVYDAAVEKLTALFEQQRIGPGCDPNTTVGPLIARQEVDRVAGLVQDAIQKGAILRYQAELPPHLPSGSFYPPTILENTTPQMRIAQEEIFGPVLPVTAFDTEEEALRLANDTPYGLAAYAYTTNEERARRLADELEVGLLGINTYRPHTPNMPFGGIKQSGIGHEGGTEGLLEYLDIRLIGVGVHT